MNLELEGKIALITGSTAGIGFAIARALASEKAQVVINGRSQNRVDDALKRIQREISDADVRGIAADLATARGSAQCIEALPSVDILVTTWAYTSRSHSRKSPTRTGIASSRQIL